MTELETLAHWTGDPLADRVLRCVMTLFEFVYPNRVAAYYVEGSYADRTAVSTSDLDVTIVFAAPFASAAEAEMARQLVQAGERLSALELDVTLADEPQLRQQADPMFKLGAKLVYGREVRDGVPLMPIAEWARQRMHAAFWLMIHVLERPRPLRRPLTFPRPGAPFYGYAERALRLVDGSEIPTTRNLIRVTGWIATARIAYQAGQYVIRKRDCVASYRQSIHDEWTALLDHGIDQRCRTAWHYRVPDEASDQAELRALLAQTLAFENHFVELYREFLVAELTGGDVNAQRIAVERLEHTLLVDAGVKQALEQLTIEDAEMQGKARGLARLMEMAGD